MNKNWKVLFLIFWLVAVLDHTSGEQLEFEFDLDEVDDHQRDRLFEYLDQNNDKLIDRNEMKLLFRQLLRSSDNKSYVNESNEKSLFFALNFTESDKTVEKPEFNGLWNYWIKVILKPRSALIVVDMQNDFVDQKTGHVYVKGSEKIVPTINDLIQAVPFETVIYTYDWHRRDHCSFIENVRNEAITRQIVWSNKPLDQLQVGDSVRFAIHPQLEQQLWPYHCIRDSEGAKLYSDLIIADNSVKVGKGFDSEVDSYSGFKDNRGLHYTVLDGELQLRGKSCPIKKNYHLSLILTRRHREVRWLHDSLKI